MKDTKPPLLGAHISIAGGVYTAADRAAELSINCFQLFTKNSNRWQARKFNTGEPERFTEAVSNGGFRGVVAHVDYLTSLASPDDAVREKSKAGLLLELGRCRELKIEVLVVHPTSHGGAGVESGIRRYAAGLREVLEEYDDGGGGDVEVILETVAGQGNAIGKTFEELGAIRDETGFKERIGVCYDTCHTFAAGYDITTRDKYESVIEEFDSLLGLESLKLFHLNDSKKGLGSNVDRHQHIGWGEMGLEPFRLIMNDERFAGIPKIIETPKEGDYLKYDRINLDTLIGLVES
ncbi:MAG: deoxyribonuclease IV [Deltaproteobacteria bacterium]|uniref:Probable endonuclease 4 n=1 Tax=Candidatus Zymogenus saltonus TaxID=2844893 RepID=A0A9D8KD18_9DELT|nr:deoxyribonuclease IV [Candidatus Zymogenus saltonus]